MRPWPNLQRMELTGARGRRRHERVRWSREASIPSGVEPARRRFVKAFAYADCFFGDPLASSTYAEFPHLGHFRQGLPPSGNRPMMTDHKHLVQPSAGIGKTSGDTLISESTNLRQARRGAAGFNTALEPTATALSVLTLI